MYGRNVVSVSWGDHLVFGEGDGRLATLNALERRIACWRGELDAGALYWRSMDVGAPYHFYSADGSENPYETRLREVEFDEIKEAPEQAHKAGLEAFLYLPLFDEGWPLPPPEVRAVSYHNDMHCQHRCAQSVFCRDHPELMMLDRNGETRQWGVSCLAFEEAREHFRRCFLSLMSRSEFDGLFICLRSQSRPADFADQFGFNQPICDDYRQASGNDLMNGPIDLPLWRHILGGYLTTFLSELRGELAYMGRKLAIGCARGDVLGPPLGNGTLQWRDWIEEKLIDHLVINQNSSQCPSLWHQLWPMHRGDGYLQNYLTGANLPPLNEHIRREYAPVLSEGEANLYIARQWDERDENEEAALLDLPTVDGLVFTSFRHDNPGPLARGDWRF